MSIMETRWLNMKKIIMIVLCGILLSVLQIQKVFSNNETSELKRISEVAASNKIELQEWKIYYRIIKKGQSKDSINRYIGQVNRDKSFSWKKEKDQHHFNIKGFSKEEDIEKRVTIDVLPAEGKSDLVMSFEIKGSGNPNGEDFQKINAPEVLKQGNRYITVQGTTKNAVPIEQVGDNLQKAFSVKFNEAIKEKDFISITGFTELWTEKLETAGKNPMNIQIGLRKNAQGQITTTIGTPIITAEY